MSASQRGCRNRDIVFRDSKSPHLLPAITLKVPDKCDNDWAFAMRGRWFGPSEGQSHFRLWASACEPATGALNREERRNEALGGLAISCANAVAGHCCPGDGANDTARQQYLLPFER